MKKTEDNTCQKFENKKKIFEDKTFRKYSAFIVIGTLMLCFINFIANLFNQSDFEIIINNNFYGSYLYLFCIIPLIFIVIGIIKSIQTCRKYNNSYITSFILIFACIIVITVIMLEVSSPNIKSYQNVKTENLELYKNQNLVAACYRLNDSQYKTVTVYKSYGIFAKEIISKETDEKYIISKNPENNGYVLTVYHTFKGKVIPTEYDFNYD